MQIQQSNNAYKFRNDFDIEEVLEAAEISAVESSTVVILKHPHKWAKQKADIRLACSTFTDDDIHMFECVALGAWNGV